MNSKYANLIKQLVRYFFTGGAAAIVEWTVFFITNGLFGVHYLLAVVISFITATFVNYTISIRYVFERGKYKGFTEVSLVYLVSFIGLLLNLLLMYIFVSIIAMHPFVSKVIATGMVFMWNFTARKVWIFK
jgi:putative flippase GtrA